MTIRRLVLFLKKVMPGKRQLSQKLNFPDQRQGSSLALEAIDQSHNHKDQRADAQDSNNADASAEKVDDQI